MTGDWVTIVPTHAEIKSTARALLALARTPLDVRTGGTGSEFLVPPYLADLYNAPPVVPRARRTKREEGEE